MSTTAEKKKRLLKAKIAVAIAQLSDPHIVARGKLFRGLIQGIVPDTERNLREFDTARYLAHAAAAAQPS